MSWFYKKLIRPALFTMNPEVIHGLTLQTLGWVGRDQGFCQMMQDVLGAPEMPVDLFGLRFPNPIGLAAGMDKVAEAVPAWEAMGFGWTELGAATRHGQPGNPRPRVFRAIPEEAIVNRMGFNNPGAEVIAEHLAEWRRMGRWPKHPVGMNLGKSKVTPLDKAAEDYAYSFKALHPYMDFFVVNVSSPNTPNLRQLQDKTALGEILAGIQSAQPASPKPVLVKVAPDLSFEALDEILELAGPRKIAGIIATNTTIMRPNTTNPKVQRVYAETGGLSGKPLRQRSTEVVRHLYRQSKGALPIVGVGGIFTGDDAWEKITAGASLLQIYTSLVYEGPEAPKQIVKGLAKKLKEAGLKELKDAVGLEAKG
jgi:dihydroorotate dehydrogenase